MNLVAARHSAMRQDSIHVKAGLTGLVNDGQVRPVGQRSTPSQQRRKVIPRVLVYADAIPPGLAAIKWSTVELVVTFMILSPLIGLTCGFLFMAAVLWITRKANKQAAESKFKHLQLCSAAAYSFSHGTNDAQKTMGIILPLLFSIGYFGASVDPNNLPMPLWVILASYTAIALGTLSGGWRIVKTMGYKITKLRPVHGFAAETARRCNNSRGIRCGNSGQHHPCDLLIHHGGGNYHGGKHGQVGSCPEHPGSLGSYDPDQCFYRVHGICSYPGNHRVLNFFLFF